MSSSGVSKQSKEGVRLCEHIIRRAFGNAVYKVASLLLNRGRMSLSDICRHTALPLRAASGAIIILMQHGLVTTTCLFAIEGGNPSAKRDGLYEFDETECLLRLRYGRILGVTSTWHPLQQYRDLAVEVIRLIMLHGRMRVRDIAKVLVQAHGVYRQTDIDEVLLLLAKEHLLRPTHPELQISPNVLIELKAARSEKEGHADTKNILSKTELANIASKATEDVYDRRNELLSMDRLLVKRNISARSTRTEVSLATEVTVQLNHDRFGVLIRDQIIANAVGERWNQGAGIVMRAVLMAALSEESVMDDARTPGESIRTITASTVLKELNNAHPDAEKILVRDMLLGSNKNTSEHIRQMLAILSGEEQINPTGTFLVKTGVSSSDPKYTVAIEAIAITLKRAILTDVVRQQLSPVHARVLSVVMAAQIASEETVRDVALLSYTEARGYLSALQRLSLVEPQEVPKTGAKQRVNVPQTVSDYHLWTIDLARAYNTLLSSFYKSIANALERHTSMMDGKQDLIERIVAQRQVKKVRKMQVKDQEDMTALHEQRRKLGLMVQRIGMLLFVIRDMKGWPQTGM